VKQQDEASDAEHDAGSLEEESDEIKDATSWALQANPAKTKRIPVRRTKQQHLGGAYAGEIYKSNIFKLQLHELLEQVKPNFSRAETSIAALLRSVKNIVEAIPDRDPVSVCMHF
jgi:U3 small nucleolar RNA-associated protein 22